jgi:hypothetical protein
VQMNQFTRGVLDRYALEYRAHIIRVWPPAPTTFTLIADLTPSVELDGG